MTDTYDGEVRPCTVPLNSRHSRFSIVPGTDNAENVRAQTTSRQQRTRSSGTSLEFPRASVVLPMVGMGRTPNHFKTPAPEEPPVWPPPFVEEPCFMSKSIVKKDGVSRLDVGRWSMLQAQSHPVIQQNASSKARALSQSMPQVGMKCVCMQPC
jgi:hypothetical protein